MRGQIVWGVVLCLLSGNLFAQEVVRIPDEPTCATCELTLETVLELGARDGPGMIDWRGGQSFPAIDSRGRVYLRGYFSTEVKVYDDQGTHLTTIGREGEGPGEFKGVMGLVIGPADSLFVFDVFNMRLSVFSPDHEFARSARLEIRPSGYDPRVFRWDPRHFYMTAHDRSAELIGWPIHQIDRQGKRVHSFGSRTGEYSPTEPYSGMRIIADAGDGRIWSGRLAHYWIDLIRPDSRTPLLQIRRVAELFPDRPPRILDTDHSDDEPQPFIADIRQEGDSLWVLTWVQDPKWERASNELEDEHLKYDSVLEVIDLATHRVVVRARFDDLYHSFLGDGRIGGTIFRGGLIPIYRISRAVVSLNRPRTEQLASGIRWTGT